MAKMYTCSYVKRFESVANGRWSITEVDAYGSWKVVECESPVNFDNCNLEGSEFTLDEAGDIRWKLQQTPSDYLPFLTCDGYELSLCPDCKYKECDQDSLALKLNLLGSETGELVPFLLTLSKDKTTMTIRYQYSPMLILKCKKVLPDCAAASSSLSSTYSLLPALQNELFSDLTITADNGKQFKAHKVVLLCACPTIDWSIVPPPLSNWPADAIQVTLHYFYAGCLPSDVQEDTVEKIHLLLKNNKRMKQLHEICAQYLESTALKRKINNLLNCIYGVIDEAYDVLNDMKNKDSLKSPHGNGLCEPKNLLEALKQITRHLALALARFALFCEIFTNYKNEMSRDERHKIIKSLKSRLLAVEDKLRQCAGILLETLCCLSLEEQTDLARFLVPEVDNAVEIGTRLAMDGKDALDKIVQSSDHEYRKKPKKKVGMKLSKALRMSMFSKEMQFLKKLQEKAASGYVFFFQRREDFNSLPSDGKATLILKCIHYAIEKGPEKIDKFAFELPENKFNIRSWKTFTKIVTSKMTWLIRKMRSHKSIVEPMLREICELVRLEEFASVVEEVVLAKYEQKHSEKDVGENMDARRNPTDRGSSSLSTFKVKDPCSVDTNTTTANINLSKSMGAVLETRQYADMKFLVREVGETSLEEVQTADQNETSCLWAHCVVLASRCDWFRRALTSGMKESIEKTIHVYDTDRETFYEFLKFIYTCHLDTESKTLENLVELMALSDQYEVDNLKAICEQAMVRHFKKDNIFEVFTLADRFNAKNLRYDVLSYIRLNFTEKDIRHNKDFVNLSTSLQKEVLGLFRDTFLRYDDTSSEDSELDGEELHAYLSSPSSTFRRLHLSDSESSEDGDYLSNTNTLQDNLPVDKYALEECIRALQEVLPRDISRVRLVEIALAADCDINRALNHYFS